MRDFDYLRDLLDQRHSYIKPLAEQLSEAAGLDLRRYAEIECRTDIERALGTSPESYLQRHVEEAERVLGMPVASALAHVSNVLCDSALHQSIAEHSRVSLLAMRDYETARLASAEADSLRLALGGAVLDLETARSVAAISNAIDVSRVAIDRDFGVSALSSLGEIWTWYQQVAAIPSVELALAGHSWEELHSTVAEQVNQALGGYEALLRASSITDSSVWNAFEEARAATSWMHDDVFDIEDEVDADAEQDFSDTDPAPGSESDTAVEPRSREADDARFIVPLTSVAIHFVVAWARLQIHVATMPSPPDGMHFPLAIGDAALHQFARALINVLANNVEISPKLAPLAARITNALNAIEANAALSESAVGGRLVDLCELNDDLCDLGKILRDIAPRNESC